MVGKGAPEHNQYAAKNGKGVGVTTYLSQNEIAALKAYARERTGNEDDWRKMAHALAKEGIYNRIKTYLDAIII